MRLSVCRRLRGLAASVALGALTLGAAAAPAAQADVISVSPCDSSPLSQPFLPWADPSSYKLAPGGDFEGSLAGWSISGPAAVVPGSESAGVTGKVGSYSMSLAAGASVQSPPVCVDAAYPSFRFFARAVQPGSVLAAAVVYQTPFGAVTLPVGVVAGSGAWAPTLPMLTGSIVPGLFSGGTAPIGLRFTEVSGTSQIDDVYVDPHTTH